MEFLDLAAILLVLAAVFGYLNLKFLKLPTTIGIMLIGLLSSVVLLVLRDALPLVPEAAGRFVESIDFNKTLMEGETHLMENVRGGIKIPEGSCP